MPHTPDFSLLRDPVHREIETEYRKRYADAPLENIIVFRSGPHENSYVPGMDYADNARALFEYMLSAHMDNEYELVWLVKNPAEYLTVSNNEYVAEDGSVLSLSSQQLERNKAFANRNVRFIAYDWATTDDSLKREKYYRVMCLAKYVFLTDAYGFAGACREDQTRIQLWHGCGFKTRVFFDSCENRYEYNIVVSDVYKEVHARIYGLRDDQVVITGYPKQDWLFQPYEQSFSEMFSVAKSSKYIFWLPTFRMADDKLKELNQYKLSTQTGLPIVGTVEQLVELNDFLAKRDTSIIVKLHPFQKKGMVDIPKLSNVVLLYNDDLVKEDIVINRLLARADALISDYSSAAVDFLCLDRPIAFTLDDVEEYENSRGFVFENIRDWLPGREMFGLEDFLEFVDEVSKGEEKYAEKRKELMNKMVWYRDGKNCERVVEAFVK